MPLRQRGAQPGNTNALTHGLYAKGLLKLRDHDVELMAAAADDPLEVGARADVDLLRVQLYRIVETGDYDPRALAALARALTAHVALAARLTRVETTALEDGVDAVLADLAAIHVPEPEIGGSG